MSGRGRNSSGSRPGSSARRRGSAGPAGRARTPPTPPFTTTFSPRPTSANTAADAGADLGAGRRLSGPHTPARRPRPSPPASAPRRPSSHRLDPALTAGVIGHNFGRSSTANEAGASADLPVPLGRRATVPALPVAGPRRGVAAATTDHRREAAGRRLTGDDRAAADRSSSSFSPSPADREREAARAEDRELPAPSSTSVPHFLRLCRLVYARFELPLAIPLDTPVQDFVQQLLEQRPGDSLVQTLAEDFEQLLQMRVDLDASAAAGGSLGYRSSDFEFHPKFSLRRFFFSQHLDGAGNTDVNMNVDTAHVFGPPRIAAIPDPAKLPGIPPDSTWFLCPTLRLTTLGPTAIHVLPHAQSGSADRERPMPGGWGEPVWLEKPTTLLLSPSGLALSLATTVPGRFSRTAPLPALRLPGLHGHAADNIAAVRITSTAGLRASHVGADGAPRTLYGTTDGVDSDTDTGTGTSFSVPLGWTLTRPPAATNPEVAVAATVIVGCLKPSPDLELWPPWDGDHEGPGAREGLYVGASPLQEPPRDLYPHVRIATPGRETPWLPNWNPNPPPPGRGGGLPPWRPGPGVVHQPHPDDDGDPALALAIHGCACIRLRESNRSVDCDRSRDFERDRDYVRDRRE